MLQYKMKLLETVKMAANPQDEIIDIDPASEYENVIGDNDD